MISQGFCSFETNEEQIYPCLVKMILIRHFIRSIWGIISILIPLRQILYPPLSNNLSIIGQLEKNAITIAGTSPLGLEHRGIGEKINDRAAKMHILHNFISFIFLYHITLVWTSCNITYYLISEIKKCMFQIKIFIRMKVI